MSRDILARWPSARRGAYRALVWLARALPLGAVRLIGLIGGWLAWWFDAGGRKVVAANLAPWIPAACRDARARAVRRGFATMAVGLGEALRVDLLPAATLREPGLRVIDPWGVFRVRPLVGPAILASVHCNWEQLGAAVHRLDLVEQVDAIALSHGDPWLDGLFDRLRGRIGIRSVLLDRAPLAALRALKAGRIVAVVADRDYSGMGLRVALPGGVLRLPVGPAALAVQTGAPIIPFALLRRGGGAWTLIVSRPLRADPLAAKHHEVPRLTAALAQAMARMIAAAPAQWLAFHPAWERSSTPGDPSG